MQAGLLQMWEALPDDGYFSRDAHRIQGYEHCIPASNTPLEINLAHADADSHIYMTTSTRGRFVHKTCKTDGPFGTLPQIKLPTPTTTAISLWQRRVDLHMNCVV